MSTALPILDEGMLSHRGRVRPLNEDCYGSFLTVLSRPGDGVQRETLRRKGRLYVVADGMGGHDSGEIASATAVQQICASYYASPSDEPEIALRDAAAQANNAVYATAQARRGQDARPMGTTIVCAVIRADQLTLAHIGDSRAYRLRGGALERLTEDHDWVTEQMRRQGWSRAEAEQRARQRRTRGVLLRALGVGPDVQADIRTTGWRLGDTLLLSSDGLHGLVSDDAITGILASHPPALAARELIAAANAAGGYDNITALVIHAGTSTPSHGLAAPRLRLPYLAVVMIATILFLLGLTVPVANGRPLLGDQGANVVRELAGLPTLAPTVGLLPTATFTATPTATAAPTSTPAPTPTRTLRPTRRPPRPTSAPPASATPVPVGGQPSLATPEPPAPTAADSPAATEPATSDEPTTPEATPTATPAD